MEEGGEGAVGRKGMGGSVGEVSVGPVNVNPGIADGLAAGEEVLTASLPQPTEGAGIRASGAIQILPGIAHWVGCDV
eukprot:8252008-Prorocentrum_lima.AAC.1